MAFEIRRPRAEPVGMMADRRLYLTRDGGNVDSQAGALVVEEGDPRAAFLLATPGTVIPAEDCARLGLELVDGKIMQRVAAETPAPVQTSAEAPTTDTEASADTPTEDAEQRPAGRRRKGG